MLFCFSEEKKEEIKSIIILLYIMLQIIYNEIIHIHRVQENFCKKKTTKYQTKMPRFLFSI